MNVGKFLMLGIITEDVDKSIDCFEHMGFHGWEVNHFKSEVMPEFKIDGQPGDLEFIGGTYRSETINIELLQPISGGLFKDFLNNHGPGIHHIEMEPKEDYASFLKEYKEAGHEVLMEVDMFGGKAGFAYLDTRDLLGFSMEIHKD